MTSIPLLVAFVAGVVSFLSPCVLPIIPGFLGYLAGGSTPAEGGGRARVFLSSFFFVLGFSIVFAALGVLLNGALAHVAYAVQTWLSRIGGAIVIFFGLYLMGFLKVGFLEYKHELSPKKRFRSRYVTSLLFGFAFAAGWTPCVGPVLGAIIGLAASVPGSAFALFLAYALGLGIPFLAIGAFVAESAKLIARYAAISKYVDPVFGFILVLLGILVFTQDLSLVANFGFVNDLLLH